MEITKLRNAQKIKESEISEIETIGDCKMKLKVKSITTHNTKTKQKVK